MQKKLLHKLLTIGVLSILLLVPLSMIESQIIARSARQAEVIRNIADSSSGAQTIVGPVIHVSYRERVARTAKGEEGSRRVIVERSRVFPLQRLTIAGDLAVDSVSRGLYRARLYHLTAQVGGDGTIPPKLGLDGVDLVDARATLLLGISDPRGVEDDPAVHVNGQPRRLVTGTTGGLVGQGAHVPLGEFNPAVGASYEIAMPLKLTGLERLAIAPTANFTRVELKSHWPHPSFQGRFLPQKRNVTKDGFEATWQVSHLARNFDRAIKANEGQGLGETLGVSLIDPVNVYLKSERAVKYGILFVALTFAAFFVTEIMRRLPIHSMQYLLVGLALAIFFLLLVALSEHIEFVVAYGVSSISCVALIGSYLAGALGSWLRGCAFATGIAALYGVLYGVLASEDNALLMGTILLFFALGATMLSTRKLDWYQFGTAATDERA